MHKYVSTISMAQPREWQAALQHRARRPSRRLWRPALRRKQQYLGQRRLPDKASHAGVEPVPDFNLEEQVVSQKTIRSVLPLARSAPLPYSRKTNIYIKDRNYN